MALLKFIVNPKCQSPWLPLKNGTIAISTTTDTTITTTIGGVRDTIERGDSRESNEKFAAAVMAAVMPVEPPLLSRLRSFLSSTKESAKKEDGMRGSIIHTSSSALKQKKRGYFTALTVRGLYTSLLERFYQEQRLVCSGISVHGPISSLKG
ncbi:hypothetical protein V1478_017257 [Vespula squamosa]|uniref:Uncharacterized protein n=1 Tax=Vespula squamosa TaxID=30214 RepID=A0ABD1ZXG4_VESSQ